MRHTQQLTADSSTVLLRGASVTEVLQAGWRAVRRFGLCQGDRFMPIDDGQRSGHDAAQEIREEVHTCPVSIPALVALHAP